MTNDKSNKKRVNITMSNELFDALQEHTKKMGISMSSYCTFVLANNLQVTNQTIDAVTSKISDFVSNIMIAGDDDTVGNDS